MWITLVFIQVRLLVIYLYNMANEQINPKLLQPGLKIKLIIPAYERDGYPVSVLDLNNEIAIIKEIGLPVLGLIDYYIFKTNLSRWWFKQNIAYKINDYDEAGKSNN